MSETIQVLIWNEGRHEKTSPRVQAVYPAGIHGAIANGLSPARELSIRTATLDDPEQGLSEEALANTDVLIWWGHIAHAEVRDDVVDRVQQRVQEGMGLIVLHSGHMSKIFTRLMGTTCLLRWREADEKERIWTVEPGHPIAEGIGEYFEIPEEEMYGERFDIPTPEKIVLLGWFQGGEVFRSGCCWERGHGRIFYFQPGHETYPIYYNPDVIKVITNAAKWAAPRIIKANALIKAPPLETL